MKKIREQADYDYGRNNSKIINGDISAFDFRGKANPRTNVINNGPWADNPMDDETTTLNEDEDILEHLHNILASAGVKDADISGITLTHIGYQKVAAQLGIGAFEVPNLITTLGNKLNVTEDEMSEDKFSHEEDILGNVTVRDITTGKEKMLRGDDAGSFLHDIKNGNNKEEVMSTILNEYDDVEDSYDDEIMAENNKFSFPWSIGERHGDADAEYDDQQNITILEVRDEKGSILNVKSHIITMLKSIAIDFIKSDMVTEADHTIDDDDDDEFDPESHAEHGKALSTTGFWGKKGAGCIIYAKSTGRFLIDHRSNSVEQPGTWGTWGGAVDRGLTPEEAVVREVKQETGYKGRVSFKELFVFKAGPDPKKDFWYHNYLAIVDEEFTPRLSWESQGFKWCEFGKWPSPIHFGLQGILKDAASVSTIKSVMNSSKFRTEESIQAYKLVKNGLTLVEAVRFVLHNKPKDNARIIAEDVVNAVKNFKKK